MTTATRTEMKRQLAEHAMASCRSASAQIEYNTEVYLKIETDLCACAPTGQFYLAGKTGAKHIDSKIPRGSELADVLEHDYLAVWCYQHQHFTAIIDTSWLKTQYTSRRLTVFWLDSMRDNKAPETALSMAVLARLRAPALYVEFVECKCFPPATEAPSIYDKEANRSYIKRTLDKVGENALVLR